MKSSALKPLLFSILISNSQPCHSTMSRRKLSILLHLTLDGITIPQNQIRMRNQFFFTSFYLRKGNSQFVFTESRRRWGGRVGKEECPNKLTTPFRAMIHQWRPQSYSHSIFSDLIRLRLTPPWKMWRRVSLPLGLPLFNKSPFLPPLHPQSYLIFLASWSHLQSVTDHLCHLVTFLLGQKKC